MNWIKIFIIVKTITSNNSGGVSDYWSEDYDSCMYIDYIYIDI